MKKDITDLFVFLDDFSKFYKEEEKKHILTPPGKRTYKTRTPCLSLGEILTIIVLFHTSDIKTFKAYYKLFLPIYKAEFPNLPSYSRFVELKSRALMPLTILHALLCEKSQKTGLYFIDSTPIPVCHNKRIFKHKVFQDIATRGKSTMGWFFGLKLHLVINERGEMMSACLTPGNVNDRTPVHQIVSRLKGLLFGDKGYISQKLFDALYDKGLKLVTGIKKNMKNKLMTLKEKVLLRKRPVIESVNEVLKHHFQIAHSRHRNPINAFVHIMSTLVAYALKPSKPSIKFKNLIPN